MQGSIGGRQWHVSFFFTVQRLDSFLFGYIRLLVVVLSTFASAQLLPFSFGSLFTFWPL